MTRLALLRVFSATAIATLALTSSPGQADGPFVYHTLVPCRLADTRDPIGDRGGPILQDNTTRNFPIQGVCSVPQGARAVSVNITAVGPNGPGYLTLFPAGTTRPVVSNLNFSAGVGALGNGAIVSLADQGQEPKDLAVFARVGAPAGAVHMVLDVTGYFAAP